MYTEKDNALNSQRIKKEVMRMGLCMLPFFALAVTAFILRIEPLCIIAVILMASVVLFIWDLRIGPLMRYKAFLAEIHSGLFRETVGALVRVSPDPVYQDGVFSREIFINIYEDMSEEGERRFLLDCAKEYDERLMGSDVVIKSHGSYVLDMAPVKA